MNIYTWVPIVVLAILVVVTVAVGVARRSSKKRGGVTTPPPAGTGVAAPKVKGRYFTLLTCAPVIILGFWVLTLFVGWALYSTWYTWWWKKTELFWLLPVMLLLIGIALEERKTMTRGAKVAVGLLIIAIFAMYDMAVWKAVEGEITSVLSMTAPRGTVITLEAGERSQPIMIKNGDVADITCDFGTPTVMSSWDRVDGSTLTRRTEIDICSPGRDFLKPHLAENEAVANLSFVFTAESGPAQITVR